MTTDRPELFEDDDLLAPEVGSWATTKHSKIDYYSALFATSMKNMWHCRVYLDLFAGAGKCRIRERSNIVPGSPLLALNVGDPFDKYIFCEKDPGSMEALKQRVEQYFPGRDCTFVPGDSNQCIQAMLDAVPRFSPSFKGLTFCFVDPYKKGEIEFATLRQIADSLYVDFLVLIPSYMDINRNEHIYTRHDNCCLDKYLGTETWRERWCSLDRPQKDFGVFIAEEFCLQMKALGYIYETPADMELIRMERGKNLPLYHLAFFSRNPLGLQFWRETRRHTSKQLTFW